jgi:hypothetical protein
MAEYGEKVHFELGKNILFPDFSLVYKGQRRVEHPVYKTGFIYFDFIAKQGMHETPLAWSSGTGDIAPHPFTISEKEFFLELLLSDALGQLKPDELVIWRH